LTIAHVFQEDQRPNIGCVLFKNIWRNLRHQIKNKAAHYT